MNREPTRLGEADRILKTTILSMRMDRSPAILMVAYQATGVLKYNAADPFYH